MFRKVVFVVWVIVLLLGLCLASFAEGVTTPGPSVTPAAPPEAPGPPTGPGPGPIITPGHNLVTPAPCVVNALRILSPLRMPMFDERLKLTDEQHTKLQDILTKSEEDLKPLIQTQKKVAEEFVTGLTKPGLRETDLQAAADLAMKAESAILTEKIKALLAVRAALQPDQVTQFNAMLDQVTSVWRPGASTPAPTIQKFPSVPAEAPTTPPAKPGAPPAKTK
jgi:hypothetical protein